MKYIKYIIIIVLFIYKGFFINMITNINKYILNNDLEDNTEKNILKNNYNNILNEYNELSMFKKKGIDYKITRLSYREPYNNQYFFVSGSFNKYDLLINDKGVVGIIKENKGSYSKCEIITNIKNMNVKINNIYSSIDLYKDGYFIITNVSNYDDIKLNDKVYTSSLGNIKTNQYIGYVYKIEEKDTNKILYVKSEVDFNNISYLYVIGEV